MAPASPLSEAFEPLTAKSLSASGGLGMFAALRAGTSSPMDALMTDCLTLP
eukprot:CAMPEP_0172912358 /NCGR_PEP_ID=MMETSP1075-20121228/188258_1 /TAXON_ID=2916 /ORGANISM="Ceratium fusus, Strain PA161109" /LENGTH=50 /DNA_ID=CAMNT_0013770835 /DNA_START=195 /DNA_END=343 /DNA_ORIENTATION=-